MILTGAVERFTLTTVVTVILTMAKSIMSLISGNELLFTLFCGTLVTLACAVVRKIKKTSKV